MNLINLLKASNLKKGVGETKRVIYELLTSVKLQFNLVINQRCCPHFPAELNEIYLQRFSRQQSHSYSPHSAINNIHLTPENTPEECSEKYYANLTIQLS